SASDSGKSASAHGPAQIKAPNGGSDVVHVVSRYESKRTDWLLNVHTGYYRNVDEHASIQKGGYPYESRNSLTGMPRSVFQGTSGQAGLFQEPELFDLLSARAHCTIWPSAIGLVRRGEGTEGSSVQRRESVRPL